MSENKQAILARLYEQYLQENINLRERVAALEVRIAELEAEDETGESADGDVEWSPRRADSTDASAS